jgi:hypothetical protein
MPCLVGRVGVAGLVIPSAITKLTTHNLRSRERREPAGPSEVSSAQNALDATRRRCACAVPAHTFHQRPPDFRGTGACA